MPGEQDLPESLQSLMERRTGCDRRRTRKALNTKSALERRIKQERRDLQPQQLNKSRYEIKEIN